MYNSGSSSSRIIQPCTKFSNKKPHERGVFCKVTCAILFRFGLSQSPLLLVTSESFSFSTFHLSFLDNSRLNLGVWPQASLQGNYEDMWCTTHRSRRLGGSVSNSRVVLVRSGPSYIWCNATCALGIKGCAKSKHQWSGRVRELVRATVTVSAWREHQTSAIIDTSAVIRDLVGRVVKSEVAGWPKYLHVFCATQSVSWASRVARS